MRIVVSTCESTNLRKFQKRRDFDLKLEMHGISCGSKVVGLYGKEDGTPPNRIQKRGFVKSFQMQITFDLKLQHAYKCCTKM